MGQRLLSALYVVACLSTLGALVGLTVAYPPAPTELLPATLFLVLIVFTDLFGVPLAGGVVSLLPMTTMAAYLVLGAVPTAWTAFIGAALHAALRYRWAERLELPRVTRTSEAVTISAANAVAHTASVLVGGIVFRRLQGETPLTRIAPLDVVALACFALVYLLTNHAAFIPVIAARGRQSLRRYIRSLPNLVFYEGSPLVLAPLMALVYTRLGSVLFVLFALTVVVAALITRSLAQTSQRLERRVRELRGLQAVGQALSADLDLDAVVSAIFEQVGRLMPAQDFYVSLYDPGLDEVSFPLAVEAGERVRWRSRRTGSGLTEYVLRSRQPLLITGDVPTKLAELGVESIGQPAECWLGVPILAGEEVLGIIAVQSFETPEAYDLSHQKVLTTIASQAAVAIQNARLYARTDEALASRVQELDSILRTAREGILLLDTDWRVLAANRALAELVGVAQLELSGQRLDALRGGASQPLLDLLGYREPDLRADCQTLRAAGLAGVEEPVKQTVFTMPVSNHHIERTLAPVRSREDAITGWLLVLRDVTEEIELARLKDDMTDMLVHDLRSPLSVLVNSFDLMEDALAENDDDLSRTLVGMAQRTSDRMLDLVNDLLDISQLESDELELERESVVAEVLLQETVRQLSPLARAADIDLQVRAPGDGPLLHVDRGLVGRVLSNLVDNAIKFTADGGQVLLWARLDPEFAPEYLLVGVSDDGLGIPAEAQANLFEKFHRLPTAEGRRSGTGLGLPFCKLAVEAHGGCIWVESPSNVIGSGEAGTTFLMVLPTAP